MTIVVKTSRGALRGERTDDGIEVFRGIPYAAPPVGTLRFRPPAAAPAWDGVRDATRFGPAALQGVRRAPGAGVFALALEAALTALLIVLLIGWAASVVVTAGLRLVDRALRRRRRLAALGP